MDDNLFYKTLVDRYTAGKASTEELEVFFALLKEGKLDAYLNDAMRINAGIPETEETFDSPGTPVFKMIRRPRYIIKIAAAAILTGVISLLAIRYFTPAGLGENTPVVTQTMPPAQDDVEPGGNRATLTLADGSRITLDSAVNGQLVREGNAAIIKTAEGSIAYKQIGEENSISSIGYNTLRTPRGGQYQVDLPDGTKVWLNAASSIRFPSRFTGNERVVELDGESYFEVARNTAMPFRVKNKNGVVVEVLGTHFNVNCYPSERFQATLLEGSIQINAGELSKKLTPGQQGVIDAGKILINEHADVEQAVAWKNGLFHFNRADIYTIMRQLERWYDVQVTFEGNIPQKEYVGKVPRNSNISEVLQILELSKIHFKINGKKITVMP